MCVQNPRNTAYTYVTDTHNSVLVSELDSGSCVCESGGGGGEAVAADSPLTMQRSNRYRVSACYAYGEGSCSSRLKLGRDEGASEGGGALSPHCQRTDRQIKYLSTDRPAFFFSP